MVSKNGLTGLEKHVLGILMLFETYQLNICLSKLPVTKQSSQSHNKRPRGHIAHLGNNDQLLAVFGIKDSLSNLCKQLNPKEEVGQPRT